MPSKSNTYKRRRQSRRVVGEGRTFGSAAGAARLQAERVEKIQAERRERVDATLADVLEIFRSDDLPAMIATTYIDGRAVDAPSAHWSLPNQLLMIRNGTTAAAGFRQWKERGRAVRKGARAFHIFGPRMVKRENGAGEDERVLIGWTLIPVFAMQSTEGDDLDMYPVELPPLYDAARRLGVSVDYLPAHTLADYRGYYSPGTRAIVLLTHDERTFWHELAHAAHDVTLRTAGKSIADVDSAEAEIVAETAAAALCRMYDRDGFLAHSKSYIEHYAGGKHPAVAAAHVLTQVQAVLNLILEADAAAASADARELVAA